MAAGTVTFEETTLSTIKKIKATWVTGSGGEAASGTTTNVFSGRFIGLITVPSDTPTDNYTVTVKDDDGVDLLLGAATGNRDQTNTEFIAEASMAGVANSKLTFAISSAGSSKHGVVYLLIR
jgi:hypothetical protein